MKNTMKCSGVIALAAVALVFAACSSPADSGGEAPDSAPRVRTYTAGTGDYRYMLNITSVGDRPTHEAGDDYEYIAMRGGYEKKSVGKVIGVDADSYARTYRHTYRLQPREAGAAAFSVILVATGINSVNGVITYNDGSTEPGPGMLSGGGYGGGGSGTGGGNGNGTHTHTYSGTWSSNAAQHWHECTANDGAKADVADHSGDPCAVCGYTSNDGEGGEPTTKTLTSIAAAYTPTTTIFPDTTLETLEEGLTVTAHYSDGTSAPVTAYTLSGTLAVGTSTVTVSYTEGGVTNTSTFTVTVHAAHTHIWGAWYTHIPATCTTAEVERQDCTADPPHYEERAGTAALGHDSGVWRITQAATCEENGTRVLECTRDQFVLQTDTTTLTALGHVWNNNYTVTTPATCSATGIETDTCTRNAAHTRTRTVDINPSAHVWNNSYTVTTPATCSATGVETDTCSLNATHTRTQTIDINPTAHDYHWEVTAPPTFIAEGEETGTCSHDPSHTDTRAVAQKHITSATDWNDARGELNTKTGSYTLYIGGSFSISGTTADTITGTPAGGITVTLKGSGTVSLSSQGFIIRIGANQTIIIDSATLELQGLTSGVNGATQNNNNAVLYVFASTARLELRNGTISGNSSTNIQMGGGVDVDVGTFTMTGGSISGNTAVGGGVRVSSSGTFTMSGGTISGNTATSGGGGVSVANGTFTMTGGTISNNTAPSSGGGVRVESGTFTMTGGTISNNTAPSSGGGVYVNSGTFTFTMGGTAIITSNNADNGGGVRVEGGTFTMTGGSISGNTATTGGGGVSANAIFNMTGGTISGNTNTGTTYGGGVRVTGNGTFHIENGTVYGSGEGALSNIGSPAALSNGGTAQRGTFSGATWSSLGSLTDTDSTIRVVNGVLQP
jgi:hypothetical protein